MAYWEEVRVEPDYASGLKEERRGGVYRRYHPDRLLEVAPVEIHSDVLEAAGAVAVKIERLNGELKSNPLAVLFTTLMRSEAISSSWIEGLRKPSRDLAVAHIEDGAADHVSTQIMRNVLAMRQAIDALGSGEWSHGKITDIHQQLLPRHRAGYRTCQVWIGGRSALSATYAAPPHAEVGGYMDDLLGYANSPAGIPILDAGLIHAQFEAIHPFEDGNGRVGRALVHGFLNRAGVMTGGIIPLSTAIKEDVDTYIRALTTYRHAVEDPTESAIRPALLSEYLSIFVGFLDRAVDIAEKFRAAAVEVNGEWVKRVAGYRKDSSVHPAIQLLIETPVVSEKFLAERLDVSVPAAHGTVKKLVEQRILTASGGKYRRSGLYQADDLLDLLGMLTDPKGLGEMPEVEVLEPVIPFQICGALSKSGIPCRNKVAEAGVKCWRHGVGLG